MRSVKNYKTGKEQLAAVAMIILLITFHFAGQAQISNQGKNFLKLTVIPITEGISCNEAKVQLIENNVVLSCSSGKIRNTFFLQKDKIYAVKIMMDGYQERLVNISTEVPCDTPENSKFTLELRSDLIPLHGLKDIRENPIVIVFNQEKQCFNDSKNNVGLAVSK